MTQASVQGLKKKKLFTFYGTEILYQCQILHHGNNAKYDMLIQITFEISAFSWHVNVVD